MRSRARERLRLSCGVRGNGWCVTHELLREMPYRFFSLTEDVEFGIALGMAGHRVAYAAEAFSNADMAAAEKTARSQRQRWEKGRADMVRSRMLPLMRAAVLTPSLICLDLAIELIVPPLSYLVMNVTLLGVLAAVLLLWWPAVGFWAWWALGCALVLVLYVLRGWQLSGIGARGLLALAHVPGFILWRVRLLLTRKSSTEWVRTEREKP